MKFLKDTYKRTVDYMRVSVTDRCNLRCIYCMPARGFVPVEHEEILRYEEIARILEIAAGIGVRKIRITGGEPLVRRNILRLVNLVKKIEGIEDLSLTTNGILLAEYADPLVEAGLDRVNISLDSLKTERYREITRGGDLRMVMSGIEAAMRAGLHPVKINVVPIRGVNDDEIPDFARMTLKFPYQIRFIEFMPFGVPDIWRPERFISSEEVRTVIERLGRLTPVKSGKSGPARYFRLDGASGVLGFISPISDHFCAECSRLRLTADGKLRPCLFSDTEIDLKSSLRSDASDAELGRLIRIAVAAKPAGHNMRIRDAGLRGFVNEKRNCVRPMSSIGG